MVIYGVSPYYHLLLQNFWQGKWRVENPPFQGTGHAAPGRGRHRTLMCMVSPVPQSMRSRGFPWLNSAQNLLQPAQSLTQAAATHQEFEKVPMTSS